MAGQFRVEPAGLTSAGGRLAGCADALGGVDLSGPLSTATGALPGSSTAGAARQVAGELSATLRQVSSAVSAMSATASTAAGNYRGADGSIASGLSAGLPSLAGFGSGSGGGGSW